MNIDMTRLEAQVGGLQAARDIVDDNNNDREDMESPNSKTPGGCSGKYLLRPRSVRARHGCDNDWTLPDTRRQKSRPAPLSKYRRKTANTRERSRMRQINTAFDKLRKMLPSWDRGRASSSEMTKITTLKHACAYIRSLQDILDSTVSQHIREGSAPEDTCPWVLSSLLEDASRLQESQVDPYHRSSTRTPTMDVDAISETDFMSLLCDSSDSGVFEDNLDSFSYLSPMCESDEVALLLLGAEPPTYWQDQSHTQFAVC
ncbi:achaete-scute complex protein T3 [Procambarus clarkii]|uniref:achaete-scute complex protein T3 n=1 Tax=Procambarus clarkii TaxID=6728 RepID=UPI001E677507|nr:myogenic factor 6-like [Procambarus clarkii]